MHITIFVYGTWGDLRPHVVLGAELLKAGHKVQVVGSPVYEDWVRERGLEFYALTTDVNVFSKENASIMDEGIIRQLQMVRQDMPVIFTQMALETYEATRNSDILITVEFGVALLFDILKVNNLKTILINPAPLNPTSEFAFVGMPSVPSWFPFKVWYNDLSYNLLHRIQWSTMAGARNDIATKHLGVPKSKFKEYEATLAKIPAITCVSQHIFQRPSDWAEHFQVTGYLIDDDPEWEAPQDLVDFIEAGEAPVYIGFGSMPNSKPEATTQLIIEAVQQTGKRAVILKGWAGFHADDSPDNIYILDYAPHSWLFPKMSALVHHGGAGTTASGFRAGVPMTIVPHQADQPYWGRTIFELGVGTKPIPRKKLSVNNLANAIRIMTSDETMRAKAQELSAKIAQEDGLAESVAWVEKFLA